MNQSKTKALIEKGEGMIESEVRFKNGIEYNFDTLSKLAEKHSARQKKGSEPDSDMLRGLRDHKQQLLKKIETWQSCPKLYRRHLYKRLKNIELSKKDASPRLEEMRRELDMLSFNLQLNPTWIRGLLKRIDEILDQTKAEQRERLPEEFDRMKEAFGVLKHRCTLYQTEH